MKAFRPSEDEWATPEEVAEAMLALIEKDACAAGPIAGGTILEVGKGKLRLVEMLNDPGPSGPGFTLAGLKDLIAEALGMLERGWGRWW